MEITYQPDMRKEYIFKDISYHIRLASERVSIKWPLSTVNSTGNIASIMVHYKFEPTITTRFLRVHTVIKN